MGKNTKRLVAVALLMAPLLFGALFTGTSQAQSGQPYTPGPGWRYGMMGNGMMGNGMMGNGMIGNGMMGNGMMGNGMMGNGMMGNGMMGNGMMGNGMMGNGMMGHGMMGNGMMGHGMMGNGMMGHALGNSVAVTDTQNAVPAGVPESFRAALESSDANRGEQLTLSNACLGCHSLAPNQMMAGPTWHDLAETAATRVAGQTAADYLYASIVHPNAYVVSGYQPNVMIQGYGQTLSEQDVADIVRYLLTLHE